jgi:RNase P subunit RPR2
VENVKNLVDGGQKMKCEECGYDLDYHDQYSIYMDAKRVTIYCKECGAEFWYFRASKEAEGIIKDEL